MRIPWLNRVVAGALALAAAAAVAGCAGISTASPNGISVVAAENFWGSIAAQIAGNHASVQSVITNPAQDPHSYEPTADDARELATSQVAIVNGMDYDPWAPKLLNANPDGARIVLDVGHVLGLRDGENPHRWYNPTDVSKIAHTIEAALAKKDPRHARYYARRLSAFETSGLATYRSLIAEIKRRYANTPVGASESIFALQAPALGLNLITPDGFMNATSEGTEVTAQDTIAAQDQITRHQIKVWIYNAQNETPEIQRLNAFARANHIPIVTITETLTPSTATFEQWQAAQLKRIEAALHQATGR